MAQVLFRFILSTTCSILLVLSISGNALATLVDRHFVFIVDFSGSVKDMGPEYWQVFEIVTGCSADEKLMRDARKQCSRLDQRDRITALKITGESRRKPELIIDTQFKKATLWDNKLQFQKKQLAQKNGFVKSIQDSFKAPFNAKNTEILSAIRLAKQYFDDIGANDKFLIILSDMVEESEYYNFQKKKVETEDIIAQEEQAKRLPDLRGINIYVSGANAPTESKYDEIKRFWVAYFERVGGNLGNNYFSRMINF